MQVSMVTHVLVSVFASLFSKGFGISAEDQVDDRHEMQMELVWEKVLE